MMLYRYFALHLTTLTGACRRLAGQPLASLLTVFVIAIALALPAGFKVILDNVTALTGNWCSVADISVYLAPGTPVDLAEDLSRRITARNDVARAELITSDAALAEFRSRSGFGDAIDALTENPLPHTIVVSPADATSSDLNLLGDALAAETAVDLVQVDTAWVARLRAMLALFNRIATVATILLGAAVVLVIGNTIRLEINNRRVEIEVMKLVGGTDRFIRRPFLYLGLLYGSVGALIAWLLIAIALLLMRGPAAALADLYASEFVLRGLSAADSARLLGGGAVLGCGGAWLAAARHLRLIEPA